MDRNNTLLILIALLFVGLFASYQYKMGNLHIPGLEPQQQQNNWQQDQGWGPPNQNNDGNGPPQWQPPSQQPPPTIPPISNNPRSYQEAVNISKRANKDMLLFFSASWCPKCEQMKNGALQDPRVKSELGKFVFYIVDADRERSVAQKYNVRAIPAYKIVNSSERVKKSGQGAKSSNDFIRWMRGISPDFMRPDNRRPDFRRPDNRRPDFRPG